MRLSRFADCYNYASPFATVYLEPGEVDEAAMKRVELRWRECAESLEAADTPARTVRALGERINDAAPGSVVSDGLVAVASEEQVIYTGELHGPVGGDRARWSYLPDLGPAVRANAGVSRQLIAVIDKEGADLRVRDVGQRLLTTVSGEDHPLHQIRGAGWSQRNVQSRVAETVEHNAALVADEIERLAGQIRPAAIVLAGEVDARETVRRRLGADLESLLADPVAGGRGPEGAESLEAAVDEIAQRTERERREALQDQLAEGLGTGLSVQGLPEVLHALRLGAVETVLFAIENPDAGTPVAGVEGEVAVGPAPTEVAATVADLRATLDDQTEFADALAYDRADAAIVRAGAASGAEAEVVYADDVTLTDGVGALLRFPVPATGAG